MTPIYLFFFFSVLINIKTKIIYKNKSSLKSIKEKRTGLNPPPKKKQMFALIVIADVCVYIDIHITCIDNTQAAKRQGSWIKSKLMFLLKYFQPIVNISVIEKTLY